MQFDGFLHRRLQAHILEAAVSHGWRALDYTKAVFISHAGMYSSVERRSESRNSAVHGYSREAFVAGVRNRILDVHGLR